MLRSGLRGAPEAIIDAVVEAVGILEEKRAAMKNGKGRKRHGNIRTVARRSRSRPAALSERMQTEGHRFVQVLAINTEAGIDVQYTFMKDGVLGGLHHQRRHAGIPIPSITDRFIAAFVFENEIHDLFGVNVRNIAIDFGG